MLVPKAAVTAGKVVVVEVFVGFVAFSVLEQLTIASIAVTMLITVILVLFINVVI